MLRAASGLPPVEGRWLVGEDFEPAYLRLYRAGALQQRAEAALRELEDCRACPRNCGCNRLANETRACHTGRYAIVSSHFPHFGEEDCLRGWRGSGTIFFGLCNLRCAFCQNWSISQSAVRLANESLGAAPGGLPRAARASPPGPPEYEGRESGPAELAAMMLELQERGCHNINFVTPEHVAPQVIEAVAEAVPRGLRVPIVYNTSAYDALSSLRLMDGIVDIYMPDFKFWNPETALRLALARDYPQRAREAILEMHRQVGPLRFGPDGLARRGVLVRHLVMPGQGEEAAAIFQWLAREVSPDTYVNVMGQYRPEFQVGQPGRNGGIKFEEINRRPTRAEMDAAHASARAAGLWRFDERTPEGWARALEARFARG